MAESIRKDGVDISPQTLRKQHRTIILYVVGSMVAAVVACALQLPALAESVANGSLSVPVEVTAERARSLLLISILTAVVEEIVFRGLLLRALLRAMGTSRAVWFSSLLFGALHALPLGVDFDIIANWLPLVIALALKFLQATLFGAVMARIITADGNLAIAIAAHALFDVIYFAPVVLSSGDFPTTYAACSPLDLDILAITSLFLAAPLVLARAPSRV